MPDRHKYHGRFNVAGEVHKFWGWYASDSDARNKFKARLQKKLGRRVFMADIDKKIVRC